MYFLTFFNEALHASKNFSPSGSALAFVLAAFALQQSFKNVKKQRQKLKWQFLRFYASQKLSTKREKGDGATIFLLILMIIACVAILWVLWALGGIFALILGIVFGLGILTLLFRK